MKRLLLLLSLFFSGCADEKITRPSELIGGEDYDVRLLFEADGVKVYQFRTPNVRYFAVDRNGNAIPIQ